MNSVFSAVLDIAVLASCQGALASCSDPTRFDNTPVGSDAGVTQAVAPQGDCPADPGWLPADGGPPPPVKMYPFATHPAPECPFYIGGFQNFLIAAQPLANGDPAIVTYPTIDDVFVKATPLPQASLAPPGTHRGTKARSWLGDIKQAGQREILIDQHGHTIYYGIHMNQAFADFIRANKLQTVAGIQNASPKLSLPPGLVEFKTAWMDVDPADGVTGDFSNYITTTAWVPVLSKDAMGRIVENKNAPRQIRVALIAVHSVYTLPGHPEMIWASIQHVDLGGNDHLQGVELGVHANSAPTTDFNPDEVKDPNNLKVTTVLSTQTDYLLYKSGTPANQANQSIPESALMLDSATQSFPLNQVSNIYRMFPGSKSNKIQPDDDVTSLNNNWAALVARNAGKMSKADKRGFYRLVGAQWLDKPEVFQLGTTFQNDPSGNPLLQSDFKKALAVSVTLSQYDERRVVAMNAANAGNNDPVKAALDDIQANGSDSPFSITGGEDRMSSTSMESFTQAPASFRNCFSCHNTMGVTSNGTPVTPDNMGTVTALLGPKLLNVSHLFSQFVLEESSP
ncbi:MAG: hypothetical protein M3O36_05750 [Myxococcota bacterium]|nr:hypothetical protein [Myxococcota bacterium]